MGSIKEEILGQPAEHVPDHVFDDQYTFIDSSARRFVDSDPTPSAESVRDRIMSSRCLTTNWCVKHGAMCFAEKVGNREQP
jgi:hypothetical protein